MLLHTRSLFLVYVFYYFKLNFYLHIQNYCVSSDLLRHTDTETQWRGLNKCHEEMCFIENFFRSFSFFSLSLHSFSLRFVLCRTMFDEHIINIEWNSPWRDLKVCYSEVNNVSMAVHLLLASIVYIIIQSRFKNVPSTYIRRLWTNFIECKSIGWTQFCGVSSTIDHALNIISFYVDDFQQYYACCFFFHRRRHSFHFLCSSNTMNEMAFSCRHNLMEFWSLLPVSI